MSRNRQRGMCLLSHGERKSFNDPAQKPAEWKDFGQEISDPEKEVVNITFDPEDQREILKTVYELFHCEIGTIPLLTPLEEKELSRRIQEESDSEAYQQFILANLRLVIVCAKKAKARMGHQSILTFMDLVQEGIIGLSTAVRRFDYKRNTRFSTYGIPWIYQRIKIAMVQHRHGFSVPGYAGTSVHALSDQIRAFKSGDFGSIPENADMDRIKVLARISGGTVPIDYPDESGKGSFSISPETLASEEGKFSEESQIAGSAENIYEEVLFRGEALELLEKRLDEKEYDIICRRFGLNVYSCQTLSEIAEAYGKSAEHIRTVVKTSMDKLRNNSEIREFCQSWEIF